MQRIDQVIYGPIKDAGPVAEECFLGSGGFHQQSRVFYLHNKSNQLLRRWRYRQPPWWQGSSAYCAASSTSVSNPLGWRWTFLIFWSNGKADLFYIPMYDVLILRNCLFTCKETAASFTRRSLSVSVVMTSVLLWVVLTPSIHISYLINS